MRIMLCRASPPITKKRGGFPQSKGLSLKGGVAYACRNRTSVWISTCHGDSLVYNQASQISICPMHTQQTKGGYNVWG